MKDLGVAWVTNSPFWEGNHIVMTKTGRCFASLVAQELHAKRTRNSAISPFRRECLKFSDSSENIQHSSPKTACNQSPAAARCTLENSVCATKLSRSQNRGEPSIFLPII